MLARRVAACTDTPATSRGVAPRSSWTHTLSAFCEGRAVRVAPGDRQEALVLPSVGVGECPGPRWPACTRRTSAARPGPASSGAAGRPATRWRPPFRYASQCMPGPELLCPWTSFTPPATEGVFHGDIDVAVAGVDGRVGLAGIAMAAHAGGPLVQQLGRVAVRPRWPWNLPPPLPLLLADVPAAVASAARGQAGDLRGAGPAAACGQPDGSRRGEDREPARSPVRACRFSPSWLVLAGRAVGSQAGHLVGPRLGLRQAEPGSAAGSAGPRWRPGPGGSRPG